MQQAESLAEAQQHHDLAEASLMRLIHDDAKDLNTIAALATMRITWAFMLNDRQKPKEALADLDKNLQMLEALRRQEPNLTVANRAIFYTQGVRAGLLEDLGRFKESVAAWEQVVALAFANDQLEHRISLARVRCLAGDYTRAAAEADAIVRGLSDGTRLSIFYRCAQVFSSLFEHASEDKTLNSSQRSSRLEQCGSLILNLLAKSRAANPEEWKKTITETKLKDDFRPLWMTHNFGTRLKQLAPPAK
jgi:hypothetical protein